MYLTFLPNVWIRSDTRAINLRGRGVFGVFGVGRLAFLRFFGSLSFSWSRYGGCKTKEGNKISIKINVLPKFSLEIKHYLKIREDSLQGTELEPRTYWVSQNVPQICTASLKCRY